jgi:hypothetical protein
MKAMIVLIVCLLASPADAVGNGDFETVLNRSWKRDRIPNRVPGGASGDRS